jgi:hypothetical protein
MQAAGDLEAELRGQLGYRLEITLPYEGIVKGQNWSQIRTALKSWILHQSISLADGPHTMQGISGVPFDFQVIKASDRGAGLFFRRSLPSDNSLPQRLLELFDRKVQKLAPFKTDGFTTILLVESDDISLMNQPLLVDAIRTALGGALPPGVDEVWHADTAIPTDLEFHDITGSICQRYEGSTSGSSWIHCIPRMRKKIRQVADLAGLVAKCAGIVVLLLYLLGAFRDQDRIRIYEQLRDGEEVPAAGAPSLGLLDHMEIGQDSRVTITKLNRPQPTWDRPRGDEVVAIHQDGRIDVLGDISQVQAWAEQESRFYLWLSFGLAAFGVTIEIILKLVPPPAAPSVAMPE